MITTLAVENYRSLRYLVLRLGQLTVVTGANGSGKSSLYRALRLLGDAARNGAVASLAREGGIPSTLWAGPRTMTRSLREGRDSSGPVGLRLGFAGDDFGYAIDLGLPPPTAGKFGLDPQIKCESAWHGPVLRPASLLAERAGPAVRLRDPDGGWYHAQQAMQPFDSMLSEIADPFHAPELILLRETIRSWRFYDHLRTDTHAPARTPQIGTRTTALNHNGADLAAALQTIREIGDHDALDTAIDQAFPGSRIDINDTAGRFELTLHQHGLLRPLSAAELSDGTLRYLLWTAALLTPRPPALMVLNEPETSLHSDLLHPLADLITTAAAHTQIIIVTHNDRLVTALTDQAARTIHLIKDSGVTTAEGQGLLDQPLWYWPKR